MNWFKRKLKKTTKSKLDAPSENVIDIMGKKLWIDCGGQYNTRPLESYVQLFQNGRLIQTIVVHSKYEEDFCFENLPKTDENGKDYVYTLDEAMIAAGYVRQILGTSITDILQTTEISVLFYDALCNKALGEEKQYAYFNAPLTLHAKQIAGYTAIAPTQHTIDHAGQDTTHTFYYMPSD